MWAADIVSGRHCGKHWHTTYGFGVIDDGAHRSACPVGAVDAYAGDIVTTNPGETHDGRPLGGPLRRQSGLSAIREGTSGVLIVTEGVHPGAAADVQRLAGELAQALREVWGVAARQGQLAKDSRRFEF